MSYKKRLLFFLFIDTIIIFLAVKLSYFLRFEGKTPDSFILSVPYTFFLLWLSCNIIFFFNRLYKRVWQYASIGELIVIVRSTILAAIISYILYIILKLLGFNIIIPRSIFLISLMSIIIGIGGSRFVWRIIRDKYIKIQPHHKKILIVGAGSAGALVAKELKHSPDNNYYPVAFIDDDYRKQNLEIMGIPVAGTRSSISEIVKKYSIDLIMIAIPSAPKKEISKIINICKTTNTQVKILPHVRDVIYGKVNVKMIRDVDLEDLLGRDQVEVDLDSISDYINDQAVLVTGAGGSIGSELCRQLVTFSPKQLILLDNSENSIFEIIFELKSINQEVSIVETITDIRDIDSLERVFKQYRPSVIFHAAAYKHVPLMEHNVSEAVKNNVFGTKNLAELSCKFGAERFVLISSDKAVNPTNVMGATKRVAELIVQSYNQRETRTKFTAVRFGNVLGSRGSVVPLFKKQIESGGPVTITHPEMVRYFMTIPEAVQLVIQAGAFIKGGEIFILDMGDPIKIVDIARDLIRLSGLIPDEDIRIIFTGVRDGEKLFEEILSKEESVTVTKNQRIFVGHSTCIQVQDINLQLSLLQSCLQSNPNAIREALKKIIPTYDYHVSQ